MTGGGLFHRGFEKRTFHLTGSPGRGITPGATGVPSKVET